MTSASLSNTSSPTPRKQLPSATANPPDAACQRCIRGTFCFTGTDGYPAPASAARRYGCTPAAALHNAPDVPDEVSQIVHGGPPVRLMHFAHYPTCPAGRTRRSAQMRKNLSAGSAQSRHARRQAGPVKGSRPTYLPPSPSEARYSPGFFPVILLKLLEKCATSL